MDYKDFIARKRRSVKQYGFDARIINPHLKDWQERIVRWAIKRGRAALFEGTGLGKTLQSLVWAENVVSEAGPVLLVAPLGVRLQTRDEASKFGIGCDVRLVNSQSECGGGINITNYDKLAKFDGSKFAGVVIDECFAPDTPIDTPNGPIFIKDIRKGDLILNASGVDVVSDVHRRKVDYAVAVEYGGARVISSPNHPWFTQRGWVSSQDLEPGDSICEANEAMRMVRGVLYPEVHEQEQRVDTFLQQVLLSEMANATTGAYSEGTYASGSEEKRRIQASMACKRLTGCDKGYRENPRLESHAVEVSARETVPHVESDEPSTFRAWWKRGRDDIAPENIEGCSWGWMGSRVCLLTGETDSRLSDMLQARLGESRDASIYRNGWSYASLACSTRRQEGCKDGFARVDGIEVLELGHPRLEGYRDADGSLYFYDIGATRHPSYSIHGCLVHNSSILKGQTGKTRALLCEMFADTRFRLACTATPSPNDHTELGNHAEFLGVMKAVDMQTQYFYHDSGDTSRWVLMPHAERDFWAWVASWAVCIGMPSDIQGDDTGYILPELRTHRHHVEVPELAMTDGMLFNVGRAISATNIHEEKRLSVQYRVAKAMEIVEREPQRKTLIWCDSNQEQDMLEQELRSLGIEHSSIRGNTPSDKKESLEQAWRVGTIPVLISKGSIFGAGMNWQHCSKMIFVGLTYSFESYYQSIRRCWRFGQLDPVDVHIVIAETESALQQSIARKEGDFEAMRSGMAEAMRSRTLEQFGLDDRRKEVPRTIPMELPDWLKETCVEY